MMIALSSYKSLHWFCNTCELLVAPKLSNLNATSTIPPDLSDHIDKKIDESMTKALQQLYKNFSQDTESIKNRLDSLQQSVAQNKMTPVSRPSGCSSTTVDHLCQFSMAYPNVTRVLTIWRGLNWTLTELPMFVQKLTVMYLGMLFEIAYVLVNMFQTLVNQDQF